MAPSIKLTYFGIEGVAEAIRLALLLSKTQFEDVSVTMGEWPALKATCPFGQLPIMTIDNGPARTQSKGLLRWVGTNCSTTLYPSDKLLDVEEAIGIMEDFNASWRPAFVPQKLGFPDKHYETEEGKKLLETLRTNWVQEQLPKYLKYVAQLLEKNNGKWIASTDEPTIADCFAVPLLRNFTRGHVDYVPTSCLDSEPTVVDYIKRFCALEPVKGRYNNGLF